MLSTLPRLPSPLPTAGLCSLQLAEGVTNTASLGVCVKLHVWVFAFFHTNGGKLVTTL